MTENQIIENLAKKLVNFLGLNTHLDIVAGEDSYQVEIKSDQAGLLIGKNGQNLAALEQILNLLVAKKLKKFVRITVDVEGFRKKKEQRLAQMAAEIADEVKLTGSPQTIFDLTAAERRVIHLTLAADSQVETESVGEGNLRFLIVKLKT